MFVFRKRAKALQKQRKKEILKRMHPNGPPDSSDDEKTKPGDKRKTMMGRKLTGKKALEKKLLEGKKILKKPHKRRVFKDSKSQDSSSPGSPVKKSSFGVGTSPRKNLQRKSLSATDAETEAEEASGETLSLR